MLCTRHHHRNLKMVEDLDDLLEDLENECSKKVTATEHSKPPKKLHRSELSLDINEILALDLEETESPNRSIKPHTTDKIKCHPVFVAGAEFPFGCSSLGDPRTCSELHCRNCDLKVSSFVGFEWKDKVDYLFLRTYMPNSKKIYEKLKRRGKSIAYACQCVCFSADGLKVVESLPWFCRGHERE